MQRLAIFVYGLLAYLIFLASFLYAVGFVGGFVVPKTIDTGSESGVAVAIVIDLLLLSVFAVQHSVMASRFSSGGGPRLSLGPPSEAPMCWPAACSCSFCSGSGDRCRISSGKSQSQHGPLCYGPCSDWAG